MIPPKTQQELSSDKAAFIVKKIPAEILVHRSLL